MFARRSDLPLERDAAKKFLPWLVALIVYLAALALAGLMVLNSAVGRWDQGLSGTLTVQIPPVVGKDGKANPRVRPQVRVEKALKVLRSTSGVAQARALPRAEIKALLEPWLGSGDLAAELPLPFLIDVKLEADAGVNLEALATALDAAVPGTIIDDHKRWLDRLILLARSIELVAAVIVLLVGLAAVAAVIFVTRTGLAVHHEVIELLHVIGAHDNYVARQFEFQALGLGLRGGGIGFALAALTLAGLGYLSGQLDTLLLPKLTLSTVQWLALAALPFVVAALSMITARVTVLRALARLP